MDKFLSNCLAVECPDLCLDWHPTKNLPLTTTNTAYGAEKKVWWKCSVCSHEWQAYINNRRKQHKYPGQKGTACPNCIGRVLNSTNSFAAKNNKKKSEEWDSIKNFPETPHDIFSCTKRKFYWVCNSCKNKWETTAVSRNNGADCPLCAKFKNRYGQNYKRQ